jgi:hypothetical protein
MPSPYFCEHMQPLTRRYAFSSSVLSLSLRISEPLKDVDSFKVVSTWIFGIKPAFSLQKEACQALYQHIICKYTLPEEKISIGISWERDCNKSGQIMQQLQNFIFIVPRLSCTLRLQKLSGFVWQNTPSLPIFLLKKLMENYTSL